MFLYLVVARRTEVATGLLAAGLYLLNPAVIIAGPLWGQVDAAGTLLFMGALVALSLHRYALAGGLAVLAGLAKPQFGLVVLPVAVVAIQRWRQGHGPRPLGLAVAAWGRRRHRHLPVRRPDPVALVRAVPGHGGVPRGDVARRVQCLGPVGRLRGRRRAVCRVSALPCWWPA